MHKNLNRLLTLYAPLPSAEGMTWERIGHHMGISH